MLGYPGAGKTTTAKIMHELTGAEHLWADHARREMYTNPTYSHKENLHLYKHLNSLTESLIKQGKSVIFDTNFNFYRDRQHLREIAGKHGADVQLVWVQAPKDIAKQRATIEAHLHASTRVLGNMPQEHFERITSSLEPPHNDEQVIVIESAKITDEYVKQKLQQAKII